MRFLFQQESLRGADPVAPPPTPDPTLTPIPAPDPASPPSLLDKQPEPKASEKSLVSDPAKPDDKAEPKKDDKPVEPAAIDIKALKMPEGAELQPELMQGFADVAKELNINQEGAQRLLDYHFSVLDKMTEASNQLWESTNDGWRNEVKADKEIGGDKLQSTLTSISKLFDQYGDKGIREALSFTGAGNHPAVVRTLANIAKVLTEGTFVPGGPAKASKSLAETFYPNMTQGA